jgi:IMP dehydrogenase
MNIERALSFDDVLLVPCYSDIDSRKPLEFGGEIDISTQMGPYKLNIPIISSPMDKITGHQMARKMSQLGGLGILHRFMLIEDNVSEYIKASKESYIVGVSVGVHDTIERASALYEVGARIFCLDIANGHSKLAGNAVKQLRKFDGIYIIAGNVCTYQGAQYLFDCGTDAVRCSIGGGSACRTRMATGIGVPTFAALEDCRKSEAFLIADGGLRSGADLSKSLAIGADATMWGGKFAASDETPGKIFEKQGVKYKYFRGMATLEAEQDFKGCVSDWKAAEGVSAEVSCKGSVEIIIKELLAGLRSSMSYLGARTIRKLKHRARFIEISHAGYIEGTPHIINYGNS